VRIQGFFEDLANTRSLQLYIIQRRFVQNLN
jgi:hypothetical protein